MMVVDFLHVLATGVLLLTRTTTFVQPAGASYSSIEVSEGCADFTTACLADDTCRECISLEETSSATFLGCDTDTSLDGVETSTALCSLYIDVLCCFDEASENACIANDNFVNYWQCVLNPFGCTVDEITCDEGEGPVEDGGPVEDEQPVVSSYSSAEVSEGCAGVSACFVDDTCRQCVLVEETSSERFAACPFDASLDGVESSTALCSLFITLMCCLDETSEKACFANDNVVNYWQCVLNENGCTVDEIACDEDGGPVVSRSGTTATVDWSWISTFFCGLFVPFLPLLFV